MRRRRNCAGDLLVGGPRDSRRARAALKLNGERFTRAVVLVFYRPLDEDDRQGDEHQDHTVQVVLLAVYDPAIGLTILGPLDLPSPLDDHAWNEERDQHLRRT